MKNTGFNSLILISLTALLCNCQSLPTLQNSAIQATEPNTEEYLQDLYQKNQYHLGLSELILLGPSLDKEVYKRFEDQFIQALQDSLNQEVGLDSWSDLSKTYFSLKSMVPEEQMTLEEDAFYSRLLDLYIDLNYTSAAEALMIDQQTLGFIGDDELIKMGRFFSEQQKFTALRMIHDEMTRRGLVFSEIDVDKLSAGVSKNDLVTGTVTIWVDRGIRMENGMGIPDRVLGSGFFIDKQGYLITNYHVIASEVDPSYEGYSHMYIKRDDQEGEKIPAKVIGWDPQMDLALIKTDMEVPYSFSFAPQGNYELGESIFAIGSPGGLEKTLTTGTISAGERFLQPLGKSLQVDVPINPGNSGGPLLNQKGQIIGVVFAGIEDFEGINFAIPGQYVKMLLPRLYHGGKVEYGWLGAALFRDLDRLLVSYTFPELPADKSGMLQGDQILAIDDIPVTSVTNIQDILMSLPVGTLVKVSILRQGNPIDLIMPLVLRPDYPMEYALSHDAKNNLILPIFGMELEPLDDSRNRKWFRVDRVYPGTIADEMGIIQNDSVKIQKWMTYQEEKVVLLQMILEGLSSGYMQSLIQIGSYYGVNQFF